MGPRRKAGRGATGVVYEEFVELAATKDEPALALRRIEVVLDAPTRDGDTVVRLLTTRPKTLKAAVVVQRYRERGSIEGRFGRLEAASKRAVRTLG